MAETPKSASDLRPIYVAQPDMRFANAFLSHELRDYAVKGENIVDKSSGEIFIKRPADGKVVSFFQNKKYMDELMLELRILLNNNASFQIPEETDTDAVMTAVNYDLVCINDEVTNNALDSNTVIPNASGTQSYHHLAFNLSGSTNGFFVRLCPRDADKALVEFLTLEYNKLLKDYSGSDPAYSIEAAKFKSVTNWEISDCQLYYTLTAYTSDGSQNSWNLSTGIKMNEECAVIIPTNTTVDVFTADCKYMTIQIDKITYDKMQFMYKHKDEMSTEFNTNLTKFLYPDKKVLVNYINIVSVANNTSDILNYNNSFITAMMDIPEVYRIMTKMSKLRDSASFYLSIKKPNSTTWSTNGLWAEDLREVYENSVTVVNKTALTFDELEEFLANNNGVIDANLTNDVTDLDSFLLKDPTKYEYTKEEVDDLINKLYQSLYSEGKSIVSDNDTDVTDNGIVLETVD